MPCLRIKLIAFLIFFLLPHNLFSQEEPLILPPRGFRGIELTMGIEEIKEHLLSDPLFDYRGDPDVSFLPASQQTLIECSGNSYIERAYFQFHEGRLYIMILCLDQKKLDYYTMFSTLSNKYGDPQTLSPSDAVWDFEELRLSLERPLSIKYIDKKSFNDLREKGRAEEGLRDIAKRKFLEQF